MGPRLAEATVDALRREARRPGRQAHVGDKVENPGIIRTWAAALRANAPRQVRDALRRARPGKPPLVCAIGLLDEVPGSETPVLLSSRLEARFMRRVRMMNDWLGWTFPQIADWLDLIADGAMSPREALRVRHPDELPSTVLTAGGFTGMMTPWLGSSSR